MPAGNRHLKHSGKTVIDALVAVVVRMKTGLTVLVLTLGASPALSAVSFDLGPVDNSALLSGYTTYDLLAMTDTDWTAAVMLFEPTTGNIYQHAPGVDVVQFPASLPYLYPGYPAVVFDTYVIGNVAGGGGDLDGSTAYAFDAGRLDASWFNIDKTDIGTTTIGRLTLTDDTAGTMSVMLTSGEDPALFDVTFAPGSTPVVSQVIQEQAAQEPPATEWTEPDWWTAPSAYPGTLGVDFWTCPTLNPLAAYSVPFYPRIDYLSYSYLPKRLPVYDPDSPRGRLLSDYGFNTFFVLPPEEPEPDSGSSTLPEPGTAVLLGLGGLVLLRHGRAR